MSGSNQGRLPMEAASPGTRRTGYMSKQAYVLCKGNIMMEGRKQTENVGPGKRPALAGMLQAEYGARSS